MKLLNKINRSPLTWVSLLAASLSFNALAEANEISEKISKHGLVQNHLQLRQGGGKSQSIQVIKNFGSFPELADRIEVLLGKEYLVRRSETETYKSLIISDQNPSSSSAPNFSAEEIDLAQVEALLQDKIYVISFIPTGNGEHTILGSNLNPVFGTLKQLAPANPNSDLFASAPFLKECKDKAESEILVGNTYSGTLQCRFNPEQNGELNIQITSWLARKGYEQLSLNQNADSQQAVYRARAGHSIVNVLLNKTPDGYLHLIINEGIASNQGSQFPQSY